MIVSVARTRKDDETVCSKATKPRHIRVIRWKRRVDNDCRFDGKLNRRRLGAHRRCAKEVEASS